MLFATTGLAFIEDAQLRRKSLVRPALWSVARIMTNFNALSPRWKVN